MPLDPNILLQLKQPDFQNPLDAATKAMTMRDLAQRGQMQNQQIADDQALRSAYAQNMAPGPDGAPVLNKPGMLSQLGKSAPSLVPKAQEQFQQQDTASREAQMKQLKDQVEIGHQLAWSVPTGANVPVEQKQQAWSQMLEAGHKFGLPNMEKLPTQFPGDSFVSQMQMKMMGAKEQLDQRNKDREFNQKDQELNQKRAEHASDKQNKAMESATALLESSRGSLAVGQAERDIYAAQKANTLYDQTKGNPNPEMAKLYISEIGKIAQGGSPTVDELKGLTPGVLTGPMAKAWENLSGNPTPAGMQNFMAQYRDYANGVAKDAQKVIEDKYGRVIESRKKLLGDENYNTLKGKYLDRFKDSAGGEGSTKNWQGTTYKQINGHWVPQ